MPAAAANVRPATHADFGAIAAMLGDFMAQHHGWHPDEFRPTLLGFTPAIFQGWLDQPNTLHLAAEIGGSVVGYASSSSFSGFANDFMFARPGVHIAFIVVAQAMRRKGVGRALFGAIEAWARESDAEYIGLNVTPLNDGARAFYASLGYDLRNEYRTKTIREVRRFEADAQHERVPLAKR